jgi:hypothetical protein
MKRAMVNRNLARWLAGFWGLAVLWHGLAAEAQSNRGTRTRPARATPAPEATVEPEPAQSIADLELLKSAGVATSGAGLLQLLDKGPKARLRKEVEGGQLAVEAMARLAELRYKAAVPTLARIAAGDLPDGVQALLQKDLEDVSPRSRGEFEDKARRILRLNAVTALGWIGDQRGLEAVRRAMSAEPSTAMRLQIAQSLAFLGDPSGMDFVVQVIGKGSRRESAAAAAVYKVVTGQDFGIGEYTPVRLRRSRAPQYTRHWSSIRQGFVPDRSAMEKRRSELGRPARYTPRTTADYLKLAADYLDMNDARGSRAAREYLARAGSSLNGELQRIASDPNEDLDVRMEAMNWLFQNQRERAYPFLRSLRRDENPEIVDKAESLLTAPIDPLQTNYVFPKP